MAVTILVYYCEGCHPAEKEDPELNRFRYKVLEEWPDRWIIVAEGSETPFTVMKGDPDGPAPTCPECKKPDKVELLETDLSFELHILTTFPDSVRIVESEEAN